MGLRGQKQLVLVDVKDMDLLGGPMTLVFVFDPDGPNPVT